MATPVRKARSEIDLISLRSRDVERKKIKRSKSHHLDAEAVSSAWASVDLEEEEGGVGGNIDDLTVLRRNIDISQPLPFHRPLHHHDRDREMEDDDSNSENADDDDEKDDGECECAEQRQQQTSCCNVKGIGEIIARGFCEAFNNVISCIRKNITKKQLFMLLGTIVAAVFNTRNVAVVTTEGGDSGVGDEVTPDATTTTTTTTTTASEGSDVAADTTGVVLKAFVDVFVDSYTGSDNGSVVNVSDL